MVCIFLDDEMSELMFYTIVFRRSILSGAAQPVKTENHYNFSQLSIEQKHQAP